MKISFRFPKMSDLDELLNHINSASKEQTYIRKQGYQLTEKEERDYLKNLIKQIKEKKSVMLMAFSENKLVGTSDVRVGIGAEKHIGTFGIIIKKEYRGQKIGTKLMKRTLEKAVEHIDGLEIISLSVFSDNESAIHLYKKAGFKKYGKLPRGVIRKGKHYDHLYMYLNV